MPRIGTLNNKGGVGKTLVAVSLAEALAKAGKRVLVVDLDPQANATRRLAVHSDAAALTLTHSLRMGVANGDLRFILYPCGWPYDWATNIVVAPSDLDLEDRALEAGQPGAHYRLRKALYGVDDAYDFTIIDFPPSIKGHLTSMGIAALDHTSDRLLIPTDPEYDGISGVQRIVAYVGEYGTDLGFNGKIGGVIVNQSRGTVLHQGRAEQIRSTEGLPVLAEIPLRAKVAERQDAALPLTGDRDTEDVRAIVDLLAAALIAENTIGASA